MAEYSQRNTLKQRCIDNFEYSPLNREIQSVSRACVLKKPFCGGCPIICKYYREQHANVVIREGLNFSRTTSILSQGTSAFKGKKLCDSAKAEPEKACFSKDQWLSAKVSRGFSNSLNHFQPCSPTELVADMRKRTTTYSLIAMLCYQLWLHLFIYLGPLLFSSMELILQMEKKGGGGGCKGPYPSKAPRETAHVFQIWKTF